MSLETVMLWQKRARPTPDAKAIDRQLGVHLEEVCEMFEAAAFVNLTEGSDRDPIPGVDMLAYANLKALADALKQGRIGVVITDRKGMLDSLGDQIVTGVGVGYTASMDVPEAVTRINTSNWSKFVDGLPIYTEQGKIAKGPDYVPPDLEGLY